MNAPRRSADLLRRLPALLVLVAAMVGVPMGLWRLGGDHLPDTVPSWVQVTAALRGPDTGAVFLGLLVVIGWAAWAVFAVSVAVELAAQLRGLPPVRLPGLAAPQQLAGLLVAAVIGVGTAPLLAVPAMAGPPVVAEQPVDDEAPPAPTTAAEPAPPAASGPTYTVQPRDTLGRIGARYLGDWTRFEEILDLNRGRLQPDGGTLTDPGLIRAGWTLVLPPDAAVPVSDGGQVTVQPGDTLADLAEEHGLDSWQPIFDLNAGEPQPGGECFTDPDLIIPGQVLDLPDADPPVASSAPSSGDAPPASEEPPAPPSSPPAADESAAPTQPLPVPTGTPTPDNPSNEQESASTAGAADHEADEDRSPDLAVVLSGSGALLAAGLGGAWLAHHRQRLRRRRSGRRLTPLPAELSGNQRALASAAAVGQADYAALDRALRTLAVLISRDPDGRLPDIVAARLDGQRLELRLHLPTDEAPPAPWTADSTGQWWSLELNADAGIDAEDARARLAPYPTLVTIGTDRGRHWLLDLERVGVLTVTGAAGRREDFARHLAAELAVNSWSDLLTVTTVGFGDELFDLAPDRVHPVGTSSDPQLQATLSGATGPRGDDVLHGRLHAAAGDGWMPHVVLAPDLRSDGSELTEAAAVLRGRAERAGTAVVLGTEHAQGDGEWVLTLTDDGALLLPALDLRLPAAQLTADQARDIATLLAFERDTADEPVPAAEGDRPWQSHTDAAGALREDGTSAEFSARGDGAPAPRSPRRQARDPEVSGSTPQPTPRRPGTSSVVGADLRTPSIRITPTVQRQIEEDLEQLDSDLADWWSPDCTRPRLSILGPVTLRAHGDEAAVAKSGLRRRYEETVAYLATRPHGATVEEAAEALQPARGGKTDPVRARAYVHRVTAGARAWLGTDPTTGEKHLGSGFSGRYTLTNVLVDADLFRQLRARASVHGDNGMPDLLRALELVSGPPFAQRPSGYEWLNGLDLTLTAAICDVAHHVVTTALDNDDVNAAHAASATALLVAPDDEKVLLDAMRIAYHEGNRAEAESYVARIIDLHDGDDEMDLPLSTAEAINRARRQHLDRGS